MLVEDVVTRLETMVPELAKRTQTALALAEMLRQKALPNAPVAAFVIDNGITATGTPESSEGAFLQLCDETVSVLLVVRNVSDVRGARGHIEIHALKWKVIFALSGWAPPDPPEEEEEETGTLPIGVLVLRRGRLNDLRAGTAFYQLDFAISQQVRVIG